MSLQDPTLLAPGDGEHSWFLNNLFTLKAGGETTGGLITVMEFTGPAGWGPPPHVHHVEDEMFYVVEGEISFWCDGKSATYGPGGFAWLPKKLPHRFEIGADGPARVLQLTTPAQFEHFVRALGEPATEARLPEPTEPDVERLVRVCAEFNIDILAPEHVEATR